LYFRTAKIIIFHQNLQANRIGARANKLDIEKKNVILNVTVFGSFRKSTIFAPPYKNRTYHWRDGRVIDCSGLENRRTARYRGFESLSLRKMNFNNNQKPVKSMIYRLLCF
jgi:hypothetical protein